MKVLVVGSGGREHALAWSLASSPKVSDVFVAPGNVGTANEPRCHNVQIDTSDFENLANFISRQHIDLTVVGPEDVLVGGIRDYFDERGLLCLAPSKRAAQLEGSKSYAKQFMQRHGIPTATSKTISSMDDVNLYLRQNDPPIVIKADGLAAGKGVVIAESHDHARTVIEEMLRGDRLGDAGKTVVLEEFLAGEEASYIVLSDGINVVPFASSQDHKPIFDGDTGPNTGGMGAYSPAPVVDQIVEEAVLSQVIYPTIHGMRKEGNPFVGFLYAGLMIDNTKQVKVVEFNCRFGDPEAQAVLYRLQSGLFEACMSAAKGNLDGVELTFSKDTSLMVVLASKGYPENPRKGDRIVGLGDVSRDTKVFHAGTIEEAGTVKTAGGRVLGIASLGADIATAQQNAYREAEKIQWSGIQYRRDIGNRGIARESN